MSKDTISQISRVSPVATKFGEHVRTCDECRENIVSMMVDAEVPLKLCDEGKRLLRQMFN